MKLPLTFLGHIVHHDNTDDCDIRKLEITRNSLYTNVYESFRSTIYFAF